MSVEIVVEVQVTCDRCGGDLSAVTGITYGTDVYTIKVVPCDDCLSEAEAEGYERCEKENEL